MFEETRRFIGNIGVDSGQMMLIDPCYLDKWDATSYGEDIEDKQGLSYAGACNATLGEDGAGILNFDAGHSGAAAVCRAGFGDGMYNVYVTEVDFGQLGQRVVKLEIIFVDPYEAWEE